MQKFKKIYFDCAYFQSKRFSWCRIFLHVQNMKIELPDQLSLKCACVEFDFWRAPDNGCWVIRAKMVASVLDESAKSWWKIEQICLIEKIAISYIMSAVSGEKIRKISKRWTISNFSYKFLQTTNKNKREYTNKTEGERFWNIETSCMSSFKSLLWKKCMIDW